MLKAAPIAAWQNFLESRPKRVGRINRDTITHAMLYARSIILLVLAAVNSVGAFTAGAVAPRVRHQQVRMMADDVDLDNPFLKAINGLQEAFQNSPAATFKKGLAKMQAGDYDETAIKAKLDSYISEPAVMFSFTT